MVYIIRHILTNSGGTLMTIVSVVHHPGGVVPLSGGTGTGVTDETLAAADGKEEQGKNEGEHSEQGGPAVKQET